MSDGAHLGIGADRALDTVLGGEPQPTAEERRTPEDMETWLMGASVETSHDSYGECARYAAKLILEYLKADPARLQIPSEPVFQRDDDGRLAYNDEGGLIQLEKGLDQRMAEDGFSLDDLGLTGFMWGWAVNAVRFCMDQPPVPNPAIISF